MRGGLRDFQVLVALAEERHFGRAAERLGVGQPQLSQSVAAIEAWAGAPLFTRRPQVKATPAGEALIEAAQAALLEVERGLARARRIQAGRAGLVRVGFVSTTMLTALPLAFDAFRSANPDVEFAFREGTSAGLADELAAARLDVAFVRAGPNLEGRRIVLTEPFVAAVRAGDGPTDGRLKSLAELAERSFVLFPRPTAPAFHDQIVRVCVDAGFSPRIDHEAVGWPSLLALVRSGYGVTVGPASLRRLNWEGLSYLDLPEGSATTSIAMDWSPSGSPAVLAFVRSVADGPG